MRQFAAPLKVSASSKSDGAGNTGPSSGLGSGVGVGNTRSATGTFGGANKGKGIGSNTASSPLGPAKVDEISSPHELTVYVEQLLTQIEGKFDDMSTQILERMTAMSSRVDALEASIQDLINNSDGQPATPGTPAGTTR